MVKVIIEKDGDYGYIHFEGKIPLESLPKIGEKIELFYPDGWVLELRKVIYIRKVFGNEGDFYFKIIVEHKAYEFEE